MESMPGVFVMGERLCQSLSGSAAREMVSSSKDAIGVPTKGEERNTLDNPNMHKLHMIAG